MVDIRVEGHHRLDEPRSQIHELARLVVFPGAEGDFERIVEPVARLAELADGIGVLPVVGQGNAAVGIAQSE